MGHLDLCKEDILLLSGGTASATEAEAETGDFGNLSRRRSKAP